MNLHLPTKFLASLLSDPAPLNILYSTKVKPRTPKYKEASYITGISVRQKATPTYPTNRSIDTMQSEGQPGLTAQKGRVGDWLTAVSCQDPAAIKSAAELYVASVLRGYADVTCNVVLAYNIVLHVCILYSACT